MVQGEELTCRLSSVKERRSKGQAKGSSQWIGRWPRVRIGRLSCKLHGNVLKSARFARAANKLTGVARN
jgi:hypothetical protein